MSVTAICPECGWADCICDDDGFDDDWDCTHCGGEGMCANGAECEPGWTTGEHYCHACKGTGARKDQVIF